MPTARKKSCKKVSIVEPCTTPPEPCPLCGRCGPIDTPCQVEPPEPPTAVTAENLSQEIDAAFDALEVQLPPSVRKRITARLLKRSLHPTSEEGVELIRTTCAQYLAKKERAKVASAARRAAKKEVANGDGTVEQSEDTA